VPRRGFESSGTFFRRVYSASYGRLPQRNEVVSVAFTTRITTNFCGGYMPPKHRRCAVRGVTRLRNAGNPPRKTLPKRRRSDDDGYYPLGVFVDCHMYFDHVPLNIMVHDFVMYKKTRGLRYCLLYGIGIVEATITLFAFASWVTRPSGVLCLENCLK
jgi:hypothetical protein